jgi:hypothetical protein
MDFFLSKSEKVIADFFINDSSLFIDLISEYYPLDKSLIYKCQDRLDWQKLSINENIIWTNDLIESYLGKWNWGNTYDEDGYYEPVRIPGLNTNFSFPWSVDLIKKYKDKCDWIFISKNQNIIWNINLLNELKENLDWSFIMEIVNPHLIVFYIDKYIDPNELKELKNKNSIFEAFQRCFFWTPELIEMYNDRWFCSHLYKIENSPNFLKLIDKYPRIWDWNLLSSNEEILWTEELINRYEYKWNWQNLSENSSLCWSAEFIEKYKNYWDYEELARNNSILWTIQSIDKYQLEWRHLQFNTGMLWTIDLLERFEKEIDLNVEEDKDSFAELLTWEKLSQGKMFFWTRVYNVDWSIKLICRFEDKLNWEHLSCNENLPWNVELINTFLLKWNIEKFLMTFLWNKEIIDKLPSICKWWYISYAENVELTPELMLKYQNELDWQKLSYNQNLKWSEELIDTFHDKWSWSYLYSNSSLPWSVEFLKKYDDYWVRDKRFGGIYKIELSIDFLENCSEKFLSSDKLWLFFENKINTKLVEYIFNNLKKENE